MKHKKYINKFCKDNKKTREYIQRHKNFQDKSGNTLSMAMMSANIVPPKKYWCNPTL